MSIWKKSNYTSNIEFLIDIPIREYDISKANISVLRDANVIADDEYQYFLNCPKMEREIAIGKMQGRDKTVYETLRNGIENARRIFIEKNNIQPSDILNIRNDSICLITNRELDTYITDRVQFRLTGDYRSYYKIQSLCMYYNFDIISKRETLDVKGLGEFNVSIHKNFMLDFLAELFYTAQLDGVESAIQLLATMHRKYVNMELPIEYYRELNTYSYLKMKEHMSQYSSYQLDIADERFKQYIDISFNEKILRSLNKIYSSVYFNKKYTKSL